MRFRFLKEIFPVSSSSKRRNAFKISSFGSLFRILRHHLQEFLVLDRPAAIVIDVRDHLLDLLLLRFETQSAHRNFELLGVDGATAVGVEEVEGLLDLLLLLLSELLLLLPALVEAAERHSRRAAGHEW